MRLGFDLQGVGKNGGPTVRRRTQTDNVRGHTHPTVETVLGDVRQSYLYGHDDPR